MAVTFEMRTVQSSAWKTLWEVLKEVLTDVTVELDSTGMRMSAIDGGRVSLVHLQLRACNFELFNCPNPLSVGLNAMTTFRLIKSLGTSDVVSWYITDDKPEVLTIVIENAERNFRTTYDMKLLDLDDEQISLPSLNDNVTIVTMPSSDFMRTVRDMSALADTMDIKMKREALELSCKGDLASQRTIIGESASGLIVQVPDISDDVIYEGSFGLKYLALFCKSTNLAMSVEMLFRPNFPLILRYAVASLGTILFCLAPKCAET
jgi:proliferating cell nuclear antigen